MSYANLDDLLDEVQEQIQDILNSEEFGKEEKVDFVEELIKFLKKF